MGPQGPAGASATAYFKAITTSTFYTSTVMPSLSLPAGAYTFLSRIRVSNVGTSEADINCSIFVPGQLVGTETALTRVATSEQTILVLVGVITASSPFTASVSCAGAVTHVKIDHGTSLLATKVGSVVVQ
jgi:hypothetical protein